MSARHGNIIDVAAGIGGLSYCMKLRDTYNNQIMSLTCIELNHQFVEIGKKILPEARWICGNAFDKEIWDELTLSGQNKYDVLISNPPFGACPQYLKEEAAKWMNYTGELELMTLELALRYSNHANLILPSNSIEFREHPNYERIDSRKVSRFRKCNPQFFFMESMSIDSSIFKTDWKNLSSINVECVEINMDEKDYL